MKFSGHNLTFSYCISRNDDPRVLDHSSRCTWRTIYIQIMMFDPHYSLTFLKFSVPTIQCVVNSAHCNVYYWH